MASALFQRKEEKDEVTHVFGGEEEKDWGLFHLTLGKRSYSQKKMDWGEKKDKAPHPRQTHGKREEGSKQKSRTVRIQGSSAGYVCALTRGAGDQ